ncbi:MAG: L,D-transpeptidase family protein [Cyanobacteria bacterium J06638_22]
MNGSRRGFCARLALVPFALSPGWMAMGGILTVPAIAARAESKPFQADHILVVKSERRLYLMREGEVQRSFRVALGRTPRGHKVYEGDGRTPEGLYYLNARNNQSRFHRSLRISYPNVVDRKRAYELGRSPGGQIMIHGVPDELAHWGPDHYLFNWTQGCIAVTNSEIEMIWDSVDIGTPIEIKP